MEYRTLPSLDSVLVYKLPYKNDIIHIYKEIKHLEIICNSLYNTNKFLTIYEKVMKKMYENRIEHDKDKLYDMIYGGLY